jgi:hypothetical protein
MSAIACPFCTEESPGICVRGDAKVYVYCTVCDAQGPVAVDYEAAISAWNLASREGGSP